MFMMSTVNPHDVGKQFTPHNIFTIPQQTFPKGWLCWTPFTFRFYLYYLSGTVA